MARGCLPQNRLCLVCLFVLFIDCMQAVRLMAVYISYKRVPPIHYKLTFREFPRLISLWGALLPVSFWPTPPRFSPFSFLLPSSPPSCLLGVCGAYIPFGK